MIEALKLSITPPVLNGVDLSLFGWAVDLSRWLNHWARRLNLEQTIRGNTACDIARSSSDSSSLGRIRIDDCRGSLAKISGSDASLIQRSR